VVVNSTGHKQSLESKNVRGISEHLNKPKLMASDEGTGLNLQEYSVSLVLVDNKMDDRPRGRKVTMVVVCLEFRHHPSTCHKPTLIHKDRRISVD